MTEEMTDALPAEPVEVVSIKFRNRGKAYFFDPAGLSLTEGTKVVVETAKGLEMGDVIRGNHLIEPKCVVQPLRCVARVATADDLRIEALCREREREAFVIGKQKIADHGLEMKLVDVECSFEGNKILFFFSSDGRVDFRELVKDLAGVFRTRIELRQIGVRDEARMLGGLGICGRPFCCGSFMEDFAPVSTKMAKTQSMSLNPAKISGCCGRLMCCLRYEQAAYEELVKNVPKNGAFVETPDGYGNVTQVNVLRQTVKVKLDGPGDDSFHIYDADEVAAIPGGRPRDGSQPPHILVLKPKKTEEPEPQESGWEIQEHLAAPAGERRQPAERQSGSRHGNRSRSRKEGQPREGQQDAQTKSHRQQKPRSQNKAQSGGQKHNAPQKQGGGQKPNAARQDNAPGEKAGGQKHKNRGPKPSAAPNAPAGENASGTKPKRPNHNRRRPKPKKPNDGGTPKQEGST